LHLPGSIITIGTFDGVHRGHRRIFNAVCARAKRTGCKPIVLSFTCPPKHCLNPDQEPLQLTVWKEKKKLIQSCGINTVIPIRFSRAFSNRSPEDYFRSILRRYRVKEMVVGFNFAFGKDRRGHGSYLASLGARFGVRIWVKKPVYRGREIVSSSLIRNYLRTGCLEKANTLLGYHYQVSGTVIRGEGWAGAQGLPTANLKTSRCKLLPGGVYAVCVQIKGTSFPGLANCGFRPTLHPVSTRLLEVHVLRRRINLYNRDITVHFLKRLRSERVYKHKEALVEQMYRDRANAESYFRKHSSADIF
jgi:riboflavin kinase / FMN adenylyltransferase